MHELVFPARAGMNRPHERTISVVLCVPRPRGDEPPALAVEMEEEFGMTLVGFLDADKFKIYSRPHRVRPLA